MGTPLLPLLNLYRNVVSGFRIGLWLPVSRTRFRVSPSDYALLAIFNFAVWLAGSWMRAEPDAAFDPGALPQLLAGIPVTLLVCLLISRLLREDSLLLAFAVALASTELLFEVAGTVVFRLFEGPWSEAPGTLQLAVYLLYVGWALAAVLRTQAILAPWRTRSNLRSGLAAVLLVAMVLGLAYTPRDEPWSVPDAGQDDDDDPGSMNQDLFHVQATLPPPSPVKPAQGRGSRLARADSNGDGLLSRAEVERGVPRLARDFDAIDSNHDGQLSPQEIRAWSRSHRNATQDRFEQYFRRADSDGDGRLSRDEAKRGLPRVAAKFDAIDTNHDGFVSLEEMRAWLAARRALRPNNGPNSGPNSGV